MNVKKTAVSARNARHQADNLMENLIELEARADDPDDLMKQAVFLGLLRHAVCLTLHLCIVEFPEAVRQFSKHSEKS